jgi:hypothetical protein
MGGRYSTSEPDLIRMIKELQDRVSRLERTPQTANAGVDREGIIITDGNLIARRSDAATTGVARIGAGSEVLGQPAVEITLGRSPLVEGAYLQDTGVPFNGATSMSFFDVEGTDPDFLSPTINMWDKSGDPLITDSFNARRGFGDPILAVPWNDKVLSSSTSGTAVDIAQFEWYQYHAHLRVRLVCSNDAATTGTVQIQEEDTGAIIGSITTPANTTAYVDLVIRRSALEFGNSPNGNSTICNIQHARASGAGTVRHRVVSIVGIDLSWSQAW